MLIGFVLPSKKNVKGMPLGFAALAGYLYEKQQDIKISYLDTGISSDSEIDTFLNRKYDVVGISSLIIIWLIRTDVIFINYLFLGQSVFNCTAFYII